MEEIGVFILLLLIAIGIMVGVAIHRMNVLLTQYGLINQQFTNKQLQKIEEAADETIRELKKHVDGLNEKLRKDYKQNANELALVGAKMEDSFKKSSVKFEENAKDIKKLYESLNKEIQNSLEAFFARSIEKLNKHLLNVETVNNELAELNRKIDASNKKGKEIHAKAESNYEKLEAISDKTKELIAKHEINLSKYMGAFEKEVMAFEEKYKAHVNEQNTRIELLLNQLTEEFTSTIRQSADQSAEVLSKMSEDVKSDVDVYHRKNIEHIENTLKSNELVKLLDQNKQLSAQLEHYTNDNNNSLNDLVELSKKRITEIEDKMANTKKRGLFG